MLIRHIYHTTQCALLLCLLALASCGGTHSDKDGHDHAEEAAHTDEDSHGHEASSGDGDIILTEAQRKAAGITLGTIEQRNLTEGVQVNGLLQVKPQDQADVAPLTGGIVRKILVTEGQQVAAGQVVAYLENTEIISLQQAYLTAVRDLKAARTELNRQQALAAHQAGVEKNLQQARTTHTVAQLTVKSLAQQLQQLGLAPAQVKAGKLSTRLPLRTPMAGTVSSITGIPGSYCDMQTPVLSLVNDRGIYAELQVYEKDLDRIRPGSEVDLSLTNRGHAALKGTLAHLSPAPDPQTKAYSALVTLDRSATTRQKLMPGMYVTALIHTSSDNHDAVSNGGIADIGGEAFIFVLKKQHKERDGSLTYHFRKVRVMSGRSLMGFTQITPAEALGPEAKVVTKGAFYLASMIGEHADHVH